MSTATASVYEWKTLDWKQIEKQVFKLQKRIYRAAQRDDVKTVHRLQRLLMTSWSAKCLAVRRVTQDNRGKNTAGVDGVKSLPPTERADLGRTLQLPKKAQPTRRVWIPKPGTQDEKRPLGIPTLHDRAAQALAKLALEPQWEAKFEANSYGFRPGRGCHDAIEAIFNTVSKRASFVLDADIAKCFDRINHTALLNKLQTFPTLRRAIRAWLQSGVDQGELFPTTEGTPQGGVVSPLLANIALHGLEEVICTVLVKLRPKGSRQTWKPQVIRYADDVRPFTVC
jgi:RNA-directed DNA polymerase